MTLGAKDIFGLELKEISQICASHSGEDFHIETVMSMLKKMGLDSSYLKCGVHFPFSDNKTLDMKISNQKPTVLHNNCSGKHCGMLMANKILGASLDYYYKIDHPV